MTNNGLECQYRLNTVPVWKFSMVPELNTVPVWKFSMVPAYANGLSDHETLIRLASV